MIYFSGLQDSKPAVPSSRQKTARMMKVDAETNQVEA
jgi:hypothetical protein